MNNKLLIFSLATILYLPLLAMNKQEVTWYAKATGYSFATAASGALVIYSLIEILNRPPLDTFTSLIAGAQGTHYFGERTYKNIIQAWKGRSLKPTAEQAERIITERVEEKVQSMANANSVEIELSHSTSGSSTRGTLRFLPKESRESSMGIAQYLQQGNEKLQQDIKNN